MNLKLYRVNLRGFSGYTTSTSYKSSYVVAEDAESAYQKVRKWLDENKYGYSHDRELESVELLAEDKVYTDIGTRLFL